MFTSFFKMSDNEQEVEKLKEENQQLKVDTWIEKQELLKLIKRLSK